MNQLNKIFAYACLGFAVGIFTLWDAIPPAKCNDENATLYSPNMMYHNAMANRGIWGNETEAACWLRQSARPGNEDAYTSVGMTYEKGRGVAKDIGEALAWYQRAIKSGRSGGAYRLAQLFAEGKEVPGDPAKSEHYRSLQQTLKRTEPRHSFESGTAAQLKSMYQAIIHADRHLLRIFRSVLG